jgi:hypothetical protein
VIVRNYLGWGCHNNVLIGASCEGQSVIGLTGHHHQSDRWALATQGFEEENFKLVVTPIHPPPLGDIKVLSIPSSQQSFRLPNAEPRSDDKADPDCPLYHCILFQLIDSSKLPILSVE